MVDVKAEMQIQTTDAIQQASSMAMPPKSPSSLVPCSKTNGHLDDAETETMQLKSTQ